MKKTTKMVMTSMTIVILMFAITGCDDEVSIDTTEVTTEITEVTDKTETTEVANAGEGKVTTEESDADETEPVTPAENGNKPATTEAPAPSHTHIWATRTVTDIVLMMRK